MALEYSYVINPTGPAENHIVREMFDDVKDYINDADNFDFASKALDNLASTSVNTDIGMNSHKLTGLSAGTAAGHSVRFEQIKLLQVVSATGTTSTSLTSATLANTVVTASITPTSASNKVKVTAMFVVSIPAAAATSLITLNRDSTNVSPNGSGFITRADIVDGVNTAVPICFSWIDSPATTSATTYTIRANNNNASGTVSFGAATNFAWVIILEEVA